MSSEIRAAKNRKQQSGLPTDSDIAATQVASSENQCSSTADKETNESEQTTLKPFLELMSRAESIQETAETFRECSEMIKAKAMTVNEIANRYPDRPEVICLASNQISDLLDSLETQRRRLCHSGETFEMLAGLLLKGIDQGTFPEADLATVGAMLDTLQRALAEYRKSDEIITKVCHGLRHKIADSRRKIEHGNEQRRARRGREQPWAQRWWLFVLFDLLSWVQPFF
ncbi:hypothetical protein H2200_010915 [Cladophialophora chaetospira]|uniref:Uncharacterized protein n=1 Tax=Cladophialophora chaetospira TaxID=386627 RepID=A0AA38X0Z6_9EURO|nr:hypothetical protein H2200_010915 [Cladophialophora chaetospira]